MQFLVWLWLSSVFKIQWNGYQISAIFFQYSSIMTEESYPKETIFPYAINLQNSGKHLNADEKHCVCKIHILFL